MPLKLRYPTHPMACRIPDPAEKEQLYHQATDKLRAMLHGESEPLLIMTSIAAVLHELMPHYFWTGFYRVTGDRLTIGPYQGPPACLHIARGRGVCGTAWERAEVLVVSDVHAFPGHIACDPRSASEIVVPWKRTDGTVAAVLDVDSTLPSAFDAADQQGLESLLVQYPPAH